jgi:hypothetical protein
MGPMTIETNTAAFGNSTDPNIAIGYNYGFGGGKPMPNEASMYWMMRATTIAVTPAFPIRSWSGIGRRAAPTTASNGARSSQWRTSPPQMAIAIPSSSRWTCSARRR